MSGTNREDTEPRRDKPNIGAGESGLKRLRTSSAGPGWTMSSAGMAEPRRVGLRKGVKGPGFTKSGTESENTEPRRDMPSRATGDSRQARALAKIGEPVWTRSRTGRPEPVLLRLLVGGAGPSLTRSGAGSAGPHFACKQKCTCIYYRYVYVCVCMYIYIYIERERE